MSIGEKIKQAREMKGISQTELAKLIDVSKQSLYKYENNIIVNIPSEKIEKIAQVLDVSPAYLMGWDEWDEDAAEFQKKMDADWWELIHKYLSERFLGNEEEINLAYEIIIQLPRFNKDGLKQILNRMNELTEINKYLSEINFL